MWALATTIQDGHHRLNQMRLQMGKFHYVATTLWLLVDSYFLERSNSARMTLKRARELFPIDVSGVYSP